MIRYFARRLLWMLFTFFVISFITFIIIQLPPGDYGTTVLANLSAQGETSRAMADEITRLYGLDQPVLVQYAKWMWNILTQFNFGMSFEFNTPVGDLIWERVGLTVALSLGAILLTWVIALPIGIYSAVKQYSFGDYSFTFLGFLGISVPDFLIALVLMYVMFKFFGVTLGGLYSSAMVNAPWSWAKVTDLIGHIWLPMLILALGGMAQLIRVMRANLLDELHKPYVVTARAKGLPEWKVLFKYPVRVALNPFVSTVGWLLPALVSGSVILSVVLSLPITGTMLLRSLQAQDMYLAGSIVLILSALTIIGTLISDLLLAWLDPRIRLQ